MFAYLLPPCSAFPTAAARADGLAAWLSEFGWHPVVLAPEVGSICSCEGCLAADPQSQRNRYELVRVPVRARLLLKIYPDERRTARTLSELGRVGIRKVRTFGRLVRASAGNLDVTSGWPTGALRAGERLVWRERIDALWATATPISSLWAVDALARRSGLPWVADVRDSLALGWTPREYKQLPELARTRRILRRAAAVVEVTPEHARRDSEWLGRQCQTITSGFDPLDWKGVRHPPARTARAQLELVFAGKVYDGYRTLAPLFRGLRLLADTDPDAPVRLIYYGRSGALVRRDAASCGVEPLVQCRGFIAPTDLRGRLRAADVLVLPTNQAGHSGVPGGKFYEYLAARRPILAVPGHDRFVNDVLAETGSGIAATTPEEVAAALRGWLEERRRTGGIADVGSEAAIERYSIREGARKLASLLDSVTSGATPAR